MDEIEARRRIHAALHSIAERVKRPGEMAGLRVDGLSVTLWLGPQSETYMMEAPELDLVKYGRDPADCIEAFVSGLFRLFNLCAVTDAGKTRSRCAQGLLQQLLAFCEPTETKFQAEHLNDFVERGPKDIGMGLETFMEMRTVQGVDLGHGKDRSVCHEVTP